MRLRERYPKTIKFIRDYLYWFTFCFTGTVLFQLYVWKSATVIDESWIRGQLTQAFITATLLIILMPWCERYYATPPPPPENTPTT